MSIEPQVRDFIESLLNDNPVVLFMKGNRGQPQCGFSAKAVGALDMLVPEYLTIDVLQNPELREGIKAWGNWPTIPQLYVQGELIGGSDIIQDMFASGELADTLGVTAPAPATPEISLEPAALETMQRAQEAHPDKAIHLRIDAGWGHELSLAPSDEAAVRVDLGALALLLDRWSATRAHGLRIALREQLSGTSFVFDNPNAPPPVQPLEAGALKAQLDRGDSLYLFDTRGEEEHAQSGIAGARPWNEEADRLIADLPRDAALVFYCRSGHRSRAVAERYRRQGHTNVHNLEGGIEAWTQMSGAGEDGRG